MRNILALLCALVLSAAVAHADAHYWVSPTGNDALDGSTPATAWKTMTKVNSGVATANSSNGNVYVHLFPSNSLWNPAFAPTNAAADGKYYMMIGDSTVAGLGPGAISGAPSLMLYRFASGLTLSKDNLIYQGVRFTGTTNLQIGTASAPALNLRLWDCYIEPAVRFYGGTGAYVGRCWGAGKNIWFEDVARRDTIESNFFPQLGKGLTGNSGALRISGGNDSLVWRFNQFRFFLDQGDQNGAFKCFDGDYLWSYGNRFFIESAVEPGQALWYIREGSRFQTWKRDTVLVAGAGNYDYSIIKMISLGGSPPDTNGAEYGMVIDSCFFYNPISHAVAFDQEGPESLTVTNNVFVSHERPFLAGISATSFNGGNWYDHNTFITDNPVAALDLNAAYAVNDSHARTPMVRVTNNLFHMRSLPTTQPCNYHPGCCYFPGVAIAWPVASNCDSSTSRCNNNLYDTQSYITTAGDRVHAWDINSGTIRCSGVDLNSQRTSLFPNRDDDSVYGNADLMNPVIHNVWDENGLPKDFDARLKVTSAAIGIGTGGTDAGAIAYVSDPRLEIVAADTTASGGPADGSNGTSLFTFKSIGTDSLTVDTVYVRSSYDRWDINGGRGTVFYPGPFESKIAPGQSMNVTLNWTKPLQSVNRSVPAGWGTSAYTTKAGTDSVFTTGIDTSSISTYGVNNSYGYHRLVFVIAASTAADSIYTMTFGGVACTKLSRFADANTGTSLEFWLANSIPAASSPSHVMKFTGLTMATIENIPISRLRMSSLYRTGAFLADSAATDSATISTEDGDIVIAASASATVAGLPMPDPPLAGVGGLFGPIGDSGVRAYSIAMVLPDGSPTTISFTGAEANQLVGWVVLRRAMQPIAPLTNGVVLATDDPAYTDIGFNISWPWGP